MPNQPKVPTALMLVFFYFLFLIGCKKPEAETINKFADTVITKIADFQDRRLSDSLYIYFESDKPIYRHDAVLAFASIQDTLASPRIGKLLLNDPDNNVRQAAAFSLGQTKGQTATKVLAQSISTEKNEAVLKTILEALGKSAPAKNLFLDTLEQKADQLKAGYAWMNYRLGLRGLSDSSMVTESLSFLDAPNTEDTRFGGASFFARGAKDFEFAEKALEHAAQNDSSFKVRMGAAFALRKLKTDASLQILLNRALRDTDYRVRVNAVRALQPFSFEKTKDVLFKALNDENINVAIAAAETIKATAAQAFWKDIITQARITRNWRTQADLYEASLIALNNKDVVAEIFTLYNRSTNPYQKGWLLLALQHTVMAYDFITAELKQSQVPIIKLSAASALVSINALEEFPSSLTKTFATIYTEGINAGDAGVVSTFAAALADSTLGYKMIIKDFSFLHKAKEKFSLPKHVETIQPLNDAIAYFEGKKAIPITNEFNHPIDWILVKTTARNQQVVIRTSKGKIIMQLLVEEAPGSVANFVSLANSHYFDHKLFHRVVPNFVVQGGCNRGDGLGSEDYSIRSEFSTRKYTTGSVGMASAGKDTEGTQWFITHSPTPHLDGRYTIFAEVVQGMDVVHKLEVGDEIISVTLKK